MLQRCQTADYLNSISISPYLEMGAYEALWCTEGTTFKSLADKFAQHPDSFPSTFVEFDEANEYAAAVHQRLSDAGITEYGVSVSGAGEYPAKLSDAAAPVRLLYYKGWWNLTDSPCVAVVGSRNPSKDGIARTRRLVRCLVADGFTVVSGLAAGVDRVAHETALEEGGQTIAVLGTPLSRTYPKENSLLQQRIAETCLVVSQVPVQRYESRDWRWIRGFFPERNKTMSALSEATIIVEAGESSGTLIQAQAALRQGRRLFILDNCFRNPRLTWPERFRTKGAIKVREFGDIQRNLPAAIPEN